MITKETHLKAMLQEAAVIVLDGVGYRISYCEDDFIMGVDEETGDEVQILYDEIDPSRDFIYKLTLMNP